MNLTERYGAASGIAISGWKGYALRITVFAIGLGIYVLLRRRKGSGSGGGRWSLGVGNRKTAATAAAVQSSRRGASCSSSQTNEINDDRCLVAYNDDICPICLGAPEIGVRASCGHSLCAECLASYRDVAIRPAPLPCPLCRAPLNSITLACDSAAPRRKMLDPNAITITQDWIREYNNRSLVTSMRPLPMTRLTLFVNIVILFLIVGLIAVRLQVLAEM